MMSYNSTKHVCVDLGASETRYVPSLDGDIKRIPNNMVFIDTDKNIRITPKSNDINDNLDVTISKLGVSVNEENKDSMFPLRLLVGDLATRKSSIQITPSGLYNKTDQEVNYASLLVSVAVSMLSHDVTNYDIPKVGVYVALPPVEATSKRDYLKSRLKGIYEVEFHLLGRSVTFEVKDVETFEESFLAVLSFFYNRDNTKKALTSQYGDGYILSLDIGASTTDLAIIHNMVYMDYSGQTYKIGGNVARDVLIDLVREDYGFDLSIAIADKVIAEGRMRVGNNLVDVSKLVVRAKKEYAKSIVQSLQSYFRKVNIPIQAISAIFVSGGGSMESSYIDDRGMDVKTTNPMSSYIVEELRRVSETIAVESYDENPREANINGLVIRAALDVMIKEVEANKRIRTVR